MPIEHLSDTGTSDALAAFLAERAGWTPAHRALFDAGWRLYWERSAALARRARTWPTPRRRHVAVVGQPVAVRPYVQLLNTSAWLVYACDVDPIVSHPEFFAFVLAVGDRMALSGEVATAAVHAAAWWLERTDAECAAFAAAAARSPRPDAAAYAAVADALPWLRELHHETLRPPRLVGATRAIPGTGLLVPRHLEAEPLALVETWRRAGEDALQAYRGAWRRSDASRLAALCDWLAADVPPLLVTAERGRILWDPDAPARVGALRAELKRADAAAVAAVQEDLARIAAVTRAFRAAVVDPSALPAPAANTDQTGYTYLHATRGLIAYNLHEPGMERLAGPPLPFEHAMVGARTAHEWGHLADVAGCVPRVASAEDWSSLRGELATLLADTIAAAPAAIRARGAADLAALADGRPPGVALGRLLVTRMPDYRANLVARMLMNEDERETYVRHNVRALRHEYAPEEVWRVLLRHLIEYQYLLPALGMTRVDDPRAYFLYSTWFADDFVATGIVDESRFDALAAIVARLCACYAVDPTRLRFA